MTSRLRGLLSALALAALLAGCSASQRTAETPDASARPADEAQASTTAAAVRPRIGVMTAAAPEADTLGQPFGSAEAIAEAEPLDALPWASGDEAYDPGLDTITVSRYYYDDDGTYYVDENGTSVYDEDAYGDDYSAYEDGYSSYAADYYYYDDPYHYASPYAYYSPYTTYSPYYSYGWCHSRYYGYRGYYGRNRCYQPAYAYAGWYSPYWYDPFFFDPYYYGPGLYVSFNWGHRYNGYRDGYWDGYHDGSYLDGRRWRYDDRRDWDRRGDDDGERGSVGGDAGIAQAPVGAGIPSRAPGGVPSIGAAHAHRPGTDGLWRADAPAC